MTVIIDQTKLEEVTKVINNESQPNATEEIVQIAICEGWDNEEEHQNWLNNADAQEITEWLQATVWN